MNQGLIGVVFLICLVVWCDLVGSREAPVHQEPESTDPRYEGFMEFLRRIRAAIAPGAQGPPQQS